jgi:hypothetical protein
MERWSGIEFEKTGFGIGGRVNTSRRYSFGANFDLGDEIYYAGDALGHQIGWGVNGQVRPTDALAWSLNFNARRLTLPDQGDRPSSTSRSSARTRRGRSPTGWACATSPSTTPRTRPST